MTDTRVPLCHPERPWYLAGQCQQCYNAAWREAHPYTPEQKSARAAQQVVYDRAKRARRTPEENRSNDRKLNLRNKFGISVEDYDALLNKQNGVCAACKQPETTTFRGKLKPLFVDHDHHTQRIRGLLCSRCNTALGMAADNPETLYALTRYLGAQPYEQSLVERFHALLELTIGDSPAIRDPELRAALIAEEAQETVDAIQAGDMLAAIDGMCDLLYVTYGAAVTFGVNLAPFFDEVQRSNVAKVGGPIREDGKRLKPEGWTPPDLQRIWSEQNG